MAGPVRRLVAGAVLAALAAGCGASEGGVAPAASPASRPTAATVAAVPAAPSPAAMERSRFFALLAENGDAAVLHGDGYTDARLETLLVAACEEIHRGASVDDTFVRYQRMVSAAGAADAEALANAFADAWGAGLTTFCPDVTRR